MVHRAARQQSLKVCLLSWHPLVLGEFQRLLAKSEVHLKTYQLGPLGATEPEQAHIPRAKVYVIDAHAPRPAAESLVAAIQRRYPESHLVVVVEKVDANKAFARLAFGGNGILLYADAHVQ